MTAEGYEVQLQAMADNAARWQTEHPNATVIVRFNFPPEVAVIGCISAAIAQGCVTANTDGLALIQALWPWDVQTEPTIMMVRGVIEHWQKCSVPL